MATRKPPAKAKAPAKGKAKRATPTKQVRGGAAVARGTHYPEAVGSIPTPASKPKPKAVKADPRVRQATREEIAALEERLARTREDIEHGGSKLVDRDMPNACTPDEEAFVTEYLSNGMNGTAAMLKLHPHLTPMSAAVKASVTLKVHKVRLRVQTERERIAKRHEATREELLGVCMAIVRADPNEIVSMRAAACAFCWGGVKSQDEAAGAFPRYLDPDPACAHCAGEGFAVLHVADTRKLSPEAKALYAGMHQTKDGIKVLMHSKLDALEKAAKIIGAFEADNRQKADALGELLGRIGRSSFPVVSDDEAGGSRGH